MRTLPTPAFFYGMEPGEEISVEIDPGKTLEIRCQAMGETNEEGEAKVFFELNGQPRTVRVPDRKVKAPSAAHGRRRSRATPTMSARRCPGVVAERRRSRQARRSQAGDLLLTIEAMKMETGIHAERDARGEGGARARRARRSTPRTCWSSSNSGDAESVPARTPFKNLKTREKIVDASGTDQASQGRRGVSSGGSSGGSPSASRRFAARWAAGSVMPVSGLSSQSPRRSARASRSAGR